MIDTIGARLSARASSFSPEAISGTGKPKHLGNWFRVYQTILDDPKVQQLSAKNFRALVNLWALASQNQGALPSESDIAFKLRMKPKEAEQVLTDLKASGLIDETDEGLTPHNWNSRQFKSDSSTERVRRHRAQQRNVS
jgi:hypothetical protein